MRVKHLAMLAILWISTINLTACGSLAGDVVPKKGPTMEQIYDSMSHINSNYPTENKEEKSDHE